MKHGGDLSEAMDRHGGVRSDWLDLSTGINPHAWPVPSELPTSSWTSLPEQVGLDRLIGAARKMYACPGHLGLCAAPGTQALISWLPHLLPDGDIVVLGPTYASHMAAWQQANRSVIEVSSPHCLPENIRILVVVNPNNPDGRLLDVKSLLHLAEEMRHRDGWLIIDEAFAEVMPGASLLPLLDDQSVLVLRSFGKFFGLAGLRLGFLAGPAPLTGQMTALLGSWAVSGPAQEIATAALTDKEWQDGMLRRLADEMADLTLSLSMAGLTVFGGTPLYALAAHRNAHAVHEALACAQIWTRVFDYAPTWIRVGLPASAEDRQRLEHSLADIVPNLMT